MQKMILMAAAILLQQLVARAGHSGAEVSAGYSYLRFGE